MFIVRLCTRSISLWRPNVSEVDHAGHAYSRVDRTTVVYTARRSSAGMPDHLSCSSRNSLLPAFRGISSMCTSQVRLLVMVINAKYLHLGYSLSVCSVEAYGSEVCPCFREINNKLFCLTFAARQIQGTCPSRSELL